MRKRFRAKRNTLDAGGDGTLSCQTFPVRCMLCAMSSAML
jgi:hypothetical protein